MFSYIDFIEHIATSLRYPRSNGNVESTALKIVKAIPQKCRLDNSSVWRAIFKWRNGPKLGVDCQLKQKHFRSKKTHRNAELCFWNWWKKAQVVCRLIAHNLYWRNKWNNIPPNEDSAAHVMQRTEGKVRDDGCNSRAKPETEQSTPLNEAIQQMLHIVTAPNDVSRRSRRMSDGAIPESWATRDAGERCPQ